MKKILGWGAAILIGIAAVGGFGEETPSQAPSYITPPASTYAEPEGYSTTTTTETSTVEENSPATATTPNPEPTPDTSANLSNDNTYINSAGNEVQSPAYSDSVPAGASAQCADGTYSFSQSRRGTCSHHGGVAVWL